MDAGKLLEAKFVERASPGRRGWREQEMLDRSKRAIGIARWDGSELAMLGMLAVPAAIDVVIFGDRVQADIQFRVEIVNSVPKCTFVSFTAAAGAPEVTAADLSRARLRDWIELAVATAARDRHPTEHALVISTKPTDETRRAATTTVVAARKPRRITDEMLQRVAEIYRENFSGHPNIAVQRAFGVEYNTASKYILRARKAGFLPPTDQGKKQA